MVGLVKVTEYTVYSEYKSYPIADIFFKVAPAEICTFLVYTCTCPNNTFLFYKSDDKRFGKLCNYTYM